MGVKSTVRLTREQAEERYVDILLAQLRVQMLHAVKEYGNEQLENDFEEANDRNSLNGEGFENYIITED